MRPGRVKAHAVIPAAAAGVPGALAVYLARPANATRSAPLALSNLNPNQPGLRYQRYVEDTWPLSSEQLTTCSAVAQDDTPAFLLTGERDLQNLNVASTVLNGSFTLSTAALEQATPAQSYGEPQSLPVVDFSRGIPQ